MYVVVGLIVFVTSGTICHYVANSRDANPVFWGVMGVVFAPLAIPFVFFAGKTKSA